MVGVAEELDLMVVVLYLVAVIMSLGLTSCLPHRLFLVHTTKKLNFNYLFVCFLALRPK